MIKPSRMIFSPICSDRYIQNKGNSDFLQILDNEESKKKAFIATIDKCFFNLFYFKVATSSNMIIAFLKFYFDLTAVF